MNLTIRRATVDDAEAIGVVHSASWREAYSHIFGEAVFAARSPELRAIKWRGIMESAPPEVATLVAEIDGTVIGFAHGGQARGVDRPRDHELYSIYVLAAAYGSGAGQGLLDATLGEQPAFVWVAADNPRAIAFYSRNGFVPDGTEKVDEFVGETIHVIRMVR